MPCLEADRSRPSALRPGARPPRGRALASLLAVLLVSATSSALAAEWTLDKREGGIEVYTRPVSGSGIKEFKGVSEFQASVDQVLTVIRDSARFKTWFPNCPESKLLSRKDGVSYQYSVMDAPWPVSDRDNVLRSVMTRDDESGAVLIEVRADPDYYPEQSGRVRVRQAKGLWRLEPLEGGATRVTFQMHLDPGGGVPEWMINARVVGTPFEALTNLRGKVER